MEIVFDGIPLDEISTSFTINGTAAIMLAMYLAVAEKQGVPFEKVTGTIQNDILKEYVARGTWIFPPDPSIRLIVDTLEYCADRVPRFNAISIAGAHFRDAGANAIQELAFTLANGITYVEACRDRGLDIERIGRRLSFFFYTHMDIFEEVAKYRAGRRLWARIMRDRFGVSDKAAAFRVGVVCGGSSLTAEQPQNNIVRVAYEALASILGGVQSMFTAAWDEALTLPSKETAELALRTQQILAFESGAAKVVDPLGGSWFVEELTDRYEHECEAIIEKVEAEGGMVAAIQEGRIQRAITDEAHRAQVEIEGRQRSVVGVNMFTNADSDPGDVSVYQPPDEEITRQLGRLEHVRATRNQRDVERNLAVLAEKAKGDGNLMPALLDCVRAYCTVGEITNVLRDVFGEFDEPTAF
jgi:methylmalonyl-CoA mutase, N-terminal domain